MTINSTCNNDFNYTGVFQLTTVIEVPLENLKVAISIDLFTSCLNYKQGKRSSRIFYFYLFFISFYFILIHFISFYNTTSNNKVGSLESLELKTSQQTIITEPIYFPFF